ncbi:MAG: 16S rRNA (guanine(966)-N(2))-methyltransferase RsmD [Synechococcaceae bacterium WB8_1B_136]|nr:16S rRNA (guanine(966)-N(2))-methyltransferase RsmD [Synechococcaceae bacterium WB8_1B_136]
MSLRLSGGRLLQSPPGSVARPTPARVRQAVMNMLAQDLQGARWLDLFCGSGVMGCEALMRGAAAVVAVDQDRRMLATSRANLEAVNRGRGQPAELELVGAEVLRWLEVGAAQRSGGTGKARSFDLIYADPPYAADLYLGIAAAVAQGGWLRPEGQMVWECASVAVPAVPEGWRLVKQKRYGTSSILVLRGEAPKA